MAASVLYYKGLRMRGTGRWPRLEAWFAAMESRSTYAAIQSDFFTHAHDLPPQLGGCQFNDAAGDAPGFIDGARLPNSNWHLPLHPLSEHSLEPYSLGDDPRNDRLAAAVRLIRNRAAIVPFAARGCGARGAKPVSAPLSDPTATPGERFIPDVDAALRLAAHSLLVGDGGDGTRAAIGAAVAAPGEQRQLGTAGSCTDKLTTFTDGDCAAYYAAWSSP
jgi:glutathione S-transferase